MPVSDAPDQDLVEEVQIQPPSDSASSAFDQELSPAQFVKRLISKIKHRSTVILFLEVSNLLTSLSYEFLEQIQKTDAKLVIVINKWDILPKAYV